MELKQKKTRGQLIETGLSQPTRNLSLDDTVDQDIQHQIIISVNKTAFNLTCFADCFLSASLVVALCDGMNLLVPVSNSLNKPFPIQPDFYELYSRTLRHAGIVSSLYLIKVLLCLNLQPFWAITDPSFARWSRSASCKRS